jgi:hypothetical protein
LEVRANALHGVRQSWRRTRFRETITTGHPERGEGQGRLMMFVTHDGGGTRARVEGATDARRVVLGGMFSVLAPAGAVPAVIGSLLPRCRAGRFVFA